MMRKPRPHGWFRRHAGEFVPIAMRFAGKPFCYVEVGCWAGNSIDWMLAHVMTNRRSHGHGIDPYLPDAKHDENAVAQKKQGARLVAQKAEDAGRWQWWYEDSKKVFRNFPDEIDLLYLDGSHEAWDVVQDFSLAWRYLKPGSVVIFDDLSPGITKWRTTPHVKEAFGAIQLAWGDKIVVVNHGPAQGALQVVSK
jgi:predicted O-methyltransferase YrrM